LNIAIRFFLGYFLIVGLAAWFVLNFAVREVEPGIRQAAEDTMVDMANLLAELAADDVTAGQISTGRFARAVNQALDREPRATIFGVDKASVDLRVYMTDAHGIVTYDSEGRAGSSRRVWGPQHARGPGGSQLHDHVCRRADRRQRQPHWRHHGREAHDGAPALRGAGAPQGQASGSGIAARLWRDWPHHYTVADMVAEPLA
jgi:hypothetical protein